MAVEVGLRGQIACRIVAVALAHAQGQRVRHAPAQLVVSKLCHMAVGVSLADAAAQFVVGVCRHQRHAVQRLRDRGQPPQRVIAVLRDLARLIGPGNLAAQRIVGNGFRGQIREDGLGAPAQRLITSPSGMLPRSWPSTFVESPPWRRRTCLRVNQPCRRPPDEVNR